LDFTTKRDAVNDLNHAWACQGTSLNPNPAAAKYLTTYVEGTSKILKTPGKNGYSLLMNTLLSMIVGIALFFF